MYVDFFRLRELPFNNTPDPRFFVPTSDHEEALASLIYAVRERKGFVLLTGEVGTGKTLVSRLMLRHFGSSIAFANINHGVPTGRDLLEAVCAEFEIQVPADASLTRLVRALHDFLLDRFAQDVPVVLVLDEAQNLPVEAFEQLRMIGNLESDDAKLLQIAIVGQPELQALFASKELRQLRQRVFRSFHLPALQRGDAENYIRHRLHVAGAEDTGLFTADAIDRIQQYSGGLPRLINTLCDNSMLSAYSANRRSIDGPFVESVIEQMMHAETENATDAGAAIASSTSRSSRLAPSRTSTSRALAAAAVANRRSAPEDSRHDDRRIAARSADPPIRTDSATVRAAMSPGDSDGTTETLGGPQAPDRTQLIRSARRQLDALRAALHGPIRSVSASIPEPVFAQPHANQVDSPRTARLMERGSGAERAATPIVEMPIHQRDADSEDAASRLRSLVQQAERSSTILMQRELSLRAVATNVEKLAGDLRGLLHHYHTAVHAPPTGAALGGRDVRSEGTKLTRSGTRTSTVLPRETPHRRPVVLRPPTSSEKAVTACVAANAGRFSRETEVDADPSARARRLAGTLRATRENLARLRTLANVRA